MEKKSKKRNFHSPSGEEIEQLSSDEDILKISVFRFSKLSGHFEDMFDKKK